ncbi:unnamed protein product [Tetraodon nigroviridis]|uniref:(spotted green pufferfish) hypothetical protein n=1 Tax=Tetraodon nigroviridis TaxID=99883 RepID=Q4S6P7_TETNG|nr:unnamed protein product [Tetraodon nigroviridis]
MSETATRRGFLDFSPVKRDDGNKENDAPTLRLLQFSRAPFLTFGTVKLGTSRSTNLQIENPTEDTEAEVKVEKIPSSKGFSVNHSTFTIPPEESFCLTVTWTPTEEGGVREVLTFTANGLLKHQAILLGRAEAPRRKKVQEKTPSVDDRCTQCAHKNAGIEFRLWAAAYIFHFYVLMSFSL